MFDHHHRVGTAGNDAAGRDRRCGSGANFKSRCNTAGDDLAIECEPLRCAESGAQRIRCPQSKAVDIGPIEWRGVDRRDHVSGDDARQRSRKRHRLAGKRRALESCLKAAARFRGRDDFEELLLPRRAADRVDNCGVRWFSVLVHCFGKGKFMSIG